MGDERLVALVRGGDARAFEVFYERHAGALLRFCAYMLGSLHDGEEAVQVTFVSARRALLADDRAISPQPWLFAIARNSCLSIMRQRKHTEQATEEARDLHDDPQIQLEQREELRRVLQSVIALPERQREALVLSEFHGLSHAEIGQVMDVRVEQVKSYVFQARSILISERTAHSADCGAIREELASARGPRLLGAAPRVPLGGGDLVSQLPGAEGGWLRLTRRGSGGASLDHLASLACGSLCRARHELSRWSFTTAGGEPSGSGSPRRERQRGDALRSSGGGDDGEPLLRQPVGLPRPDAFRGGWAELRRHRRGDQLQPGQRFHARAGARFSACEHGPGQACLAELEGDPRADQRWCDGRVREVGQRHRADGLLHARGPAVRILARQHLHARQPLFCSVPGPTYPNRRFLLAGSAYGGTVTGLDTLLDRPPAHGTIFDQLSDRHISWCDYFTDIPMTSVIPSIPVKHAKHHHRIERFFHDCRTGSLPAVSFVDPAVGALSSIASAVAALPPFVKDALELLGADFQDPGETEEDPQDMYPGELWAHGVIEAVLRSPAWERTMLIYTYDEHGGYYDHVPPPPAVAPDDIAPKLQPGDPPGDYGMYGPRVPAVVLSPHSRPGGVSDVVHDHTSVLATIEHKWNLPALTNRDAQAATVMDFLDLENAALSQPPPIQAPSATGPSGPASRTG